MKQKFIQCDNILFELSYIKTDDYQEFEDGTKLFYYDSIFRFMDKNEGTIYNFETRHRSSFPYSSLHVVYDFINNYFNVGDVIISFFNSKYDLEEVYTINESGKLVELEENESGLSYDDKEKGKILIFPRGKDNSNE